MRVLDANNNISLTNVALMAGLARTLMIPQISVHDMLVFLGTITSYQVKRYLQPDVGAPDDVAALQQTVEAMQTKLTALQIGQQITRRPS